MVNSCNAFTAWLQLTTQNYQFTYHEPVINLKRNWYVLFTQAKRYAKITENNEKLIYFLLRNFAYTVLKLGSLQGLYKNIVYFGF